MKKATKEIARYVLLGILMLGAFHFMTLSYGLEKDGKLTMQFAGVIGTYLAVWGYVVKWFFSTSVITDEK